MRLPDINLGSPRQPVEHRVFELNPMLPGDVHKHMQMLAGAVRVSLPRPNEHRVETAEAGIDPELVSNSREEATPLCRGLAVDVDRSDRKEGIQRPTYPCGVVPGIVQFLDLVGFETFGQTAHVRHGFTA
jgi:hypothetical protein